MGDFIKDIPTDNNPMNPKEQQMIDSIFPPQQSDMTADKLTKEFKGTAIIAVIFFLFSLPFTQDFINNIIPSTIENPLISIAIKAALFAIIIYALSIFNIITIL